MKAVKMRQNNKCIKLNLYNSNQLLLNTLQTGASDYSKWAIGWLKDTLILNSKDIGPYAYKINKAASLETIKMTYQLSQSADSIFDKKYKDWERLVNF